MLHTCFFCFFTSLFNLTDHQCCFVDDDVEEQQHNQYPKIISLREFKKRPDMIRLNLLNYNFQKVSNFRKKIKVFIILDTCRTGKFFQNDIFSLSMQKEAFVWGKMIWTFGGCFWSWRSVIGLEKVQEQRSNLRSVWVPYFHFHVLHSGIELNKVKAHLKQFGRMQTDVIEEKILPLFGFAWEVSCLFNACKSIVLFVEL